MMNIYDPLIKKIKESLKLDNIEGILLKEEILNSLLNSDNEEFNFIETDFNKYKEIINQLNYGKINVLYGNSEGLNYNKTVQIRKDLKKNKPKINLKFLIYKGDESFYKSNYVCC